MPLSLNLKEIFACSSGLYIFLSEDTAIEIGFCPQIYIGIFIYEK